MFALGWRESRSQGFQRTKLYGWRDHLKRKLGALLASWKGTRPQVLMGFPFLSIKCWETLKVDLMEVVKDFHERGFLD